MNEKCPVCSKEMFRSGLTKVADNCYVPSWGCSNVTNHPVTVVPCLNECGELVSDANEHYTFREGVLGSGHWQCVPLKTQQQATVDWHRQAATLNTNRAVTRP